MACFALLGMACARNGVHPEINSNSVGGFVVGQALPAIASHDLLLRQWQQDENGDRYELVRVKVWQSAVEAEVHDGRIWRISIDQPGLRTEDGVEVGSHALGLLEGNPTIQPVIGPGPTIVLVPAVPCGISYLTDAELPDDMASTMTLDKAIPLLAEAKVTRILMTGCR